MDEAFIGTKQEITLEADGCFLLLRSHPSLVSPVLRDTHNTGTTHIQPELDLMAASKPLLCRRKLKIC